MFDIGWTEMLVVAIVAIIVVGPKDLPGMLRTVGRSVKKIRGMAGDFQRQFDDALKEAELDGVKKSLDDVRSINPLNDVKDRLNPLKNVARDIEDDINNDAEHKSFDPGSLFDQSKLPKAAEPVKVDVEATLAKEKTKTAKTKSTAKKAAPAGAKTAARKPAAKKTATRAKAKSPAIGKTTGKSAATARTKSAGITKKPATKSGKATAT